jgi:hypothetical protein
MKILNMLLFHGCNDDWIDNIKGLNDFHRMQQSLTNLRFGIGIQDDFCF